MRRTVCQEQGLSEGQQARRQKPNNQFTIMPGNMMQFWYFIYFLQPLKGEYQFTKLSYQRTTDDFILLSNSDLNLRKRSYSTRLSS